MKFTNTIGIDRSPATVFAYLAGLENLPRWNYAIGESTKLTAGPVGVGSRYRQTRTIPAPAEESLEVIGLEPGRTLTVRGTLNALPARIDYVLQPAASGTILINTIELEQPRGLGLLAPIAQRRIKAAVAANLEVLKGILESLPS